MTKLHTKRPARQSEAPNGARRQSGEPSARSARVTPKACLWHDALEGTNQ
jgi:hypothetical protein